MAETLDASRTKWPGLEKLRKRDADVKIEEDYGERRAHKYDERNYKLGAAKFYILSGMRDVSFHMKYLRNHPNSYYGGYRPVTFANGDSVADRRARA